MKIQHIEILVLAAQEGKSEALAALYRHFSTPMKRHAILRVHDAMVAEDLVQNVWLKVSKRLRLLQDVRVFRSWLFRALRWEIIDWARQSRAASTDEIEDSHAVVDEPNPEILDVAPLLAGLKEDERDVIELFYLNEFSITETALALSIPEGTVKSRLHKARENLRNKYKSQEQ